MNMGNQGWFQIHVLLLPWSVIWNVVLLELLSNMVRRWHICSAVAEDHCQLPDLSKQAWEHLLLPHVVTRQAYDRNEQKG